MLARRLQSLHRLLGADSRHGAKFVRLQRQALHLLQAQLSGIAGAALQAWLIEVRSAARARPIQAQVQRGPKGYDGSITLDLAGATR